MQLTYYTDYALRVLLYAAAHSGRRVTMREMAAAYAISQEHLRKIVHRLAQSGYLHTSQGRAGGMQLGLPASEISIGEIVQLMEDNLELINCAREPCPLCGACALKAVLDSARDNFVHQLKQVTLQQVAEDPATIEQLLKLPA